MTADDITNAVKFDDAIVRSRYFIDIHSPTGSGFDHENTGVAYGAVAKRFDVPAGDYYEVPYRSIVLAIHLTQVESCMRIWTTFWNR